MRALGPAVLVLAFVAAAVFTSIANSYYVFVMATLALTAIVGIGLNVLVGLTGQVSFGHVGFYAIGAYTVAILTTAAKIDFWLALPAAALLSALVGALLAAPALRVRPGSETSIDSAASCSLSRDSASACLRSASNASIASLAALISAPAVRF